jgi:nucleoside-diphosphate-sugar epimerase
MTRTQELYQQAIRQSFLDLEQGNPVDSANRLTEELQRLQREQESGLARERHVLVVGGAGYVGSVLVRKLLARGYRVRVLDALLYDNGSSVVELLDDPRFSFVRGDFCDQATLGAALADISDVVLLAALVGDPICKKYPDAARRINQEGALQLVQRLNNRHTNKFVFTSTCSNYGLRDSDEPATEESDLNPKSLYAETKVTVEEYMLEHRHGFDFSATALRLATAYGLSGRMRFDLTISEFCRDLTLGKDLLVYDESTWRPYCHVIDISNAIIKVLEAPREQVIGEVFNVGSNAENYTKQQIVEAIQAQGVSGTVAYKRGGTDPRNYRVSFDKINRTLGFTNTVTMPASLSGLIQAIRAGIFDDVEARTQFYGNRSIPALS